MMSEKNETYSASSDHGYASMTIACVLFSLGYEPSEFKAVAFDEVVERIRTIYAYKPSHLINMHTENYAVYEYLKSQNILLTRVLRRAYFDLQISSYEMSNA